MQISVISDPVLIAKAYAFKKSGKKIADIAQLLSQEAGQKIPQIALHRLFALDDLEIKEKCRSVTVIPCVSDIDDIFNADISKLGDTITKIDGVSIRRTLLRKIYKMCVGTLFTEKFISIEIAGANGITDVHIHQNLRYLKNKNFIRSVDVINGEEIYRFNDFVRCLLRLGKR